MKNRHSAIPKRYPVRLLSALLLASLSHNSPALSLAQEPLNLSASQPPLVMLTMSRDHKLYYEAYNDYSDLNDDGVIDQRYTPSIDYLGYFDSYKCYDYSGGIFTPVAVTANKKCTGSNDTYWSGDYLNYLTTARIDAIRKVLYGGTRTTDTTTQTILERSFIPQDAHSWGKEYTSQTVDGYDIREYTPLALPTAGTRHLFANVTLTSDTSPPLLRVLNDSQFRIWEWVSKERPVAGSQCISGACETSGSSWTIVPASTTSGLSNVTHSNYKIPTGSPASQADFDTLVSSYANGTNLCGTETNTSNVVNSAIYTSGQENPWAPGSASCTQNNYMSIFTGTLNLPATGNYTFGIDGDDAIDFFIDGTQRVGWYSGHGRSNNPGSHTTGALTLAAGAHTFTFRHQENIGDANFNLYWAAAPSVITDFNVKVEVCKTISGVGSENNYGRESNCMAYGSSPVVYKPTGLLHKYGQTNGMYFGLISGSYDQNTNGGVLRKAVSSFPNEIETSTGIYKESGSTCGLSGTSTCTKGIVGTINRFKITSFDYSNQQYSCGWITTRQMNNGECEMWGNPLGEMLYEGLRYFSGKTSATSDFVTSTTKDDALGLPRVTWNASTDPYGTGNYPSCSKPYFMLISDVYPSFDSDHIPGGYFSSFTGDLSGFNASTVGQSIWDIEFGSGTTANIFIGQSSSTYDGAPTPKSASSFDSIRGLAPSEPTRQGSYAAANLAYYAHTHDLNTATGSQAASTYSIALAPPLPKIEIPTDSGGKVTIIPFAKSVGGSSISSATGSFQPTNQIVDFYVDTIKNVTTLNEDVSINSGRPYYKFRINYEDVEQGADHDMDAISIYEIFKNANGSLTVNVNSEYAAGGIIQHMGYVISGTTDDGVKLVVRDVDTATGSDPDYFLDTPNTSGVALPLTSSVTFTPTASGSSTKLLENPLWYAAKFGGFTDANGDGIPSGTEWDADGDGVPDNYFLVVNPSKLQTQMDKALAKIVNDADTLASIGTTSSSIKSDTLIFSPGYRSAVWTGELNAYPVTSSGAGSTTWQAHYLLSSRTSSDRNIFTYDVDRSGTKGIPFKWDSMTSSGTLKSSLNTSASNTVDNLGSDRVTYLRGDDVTGMRARPSITSTTLTNKLGDIIHSQPQYVGKPDSGYAESTYAYFSNSNASRTKMLYVGANDGMLHGFNAQTGAEIFAYIPSEMYRIRAGRPLLSALTRDDYGKTTNPHHYFVDGNIAYTDICTGPCAGGTGTDTWKTVLIGSLGGGGQGIYALDITTPSNFTEANASAVVKWEFLDHDHDGNTSDSTITGDADLGYTYGTPYIVKLCTARDNSSSATPKVCTTYKWFAVFGNGYNSTEADGYAGSGDAVFYIVDADTGYLKKKIPMNVGDSVNPNGLSEISPVDTDGDGVVDYLYAGDLKGNVWKIDLTSDNPNNWGTAFGSNTHPDPFYVAKDEQTTPVRQPITSQPKAKTHPQGGRLLIFGTGSYIATTDPANTQQQTMYGIWDNDGNTAVSYTNHLNLQQQSVLTGTVLYDGSIYTTLSSNSVDWSTKKGWYINLPKTKERLVYNPSLKGSDVLTFTTITPSGDICAAGGDTDDYYGDALSGGRLQWSVFSDISDPMDFGGVNAYASGKRRTGIQPPGVILNIGHGQAINQRSPNSSSGSGSGSGSTDRLDLGTNAAGRISWREILTD